MPAKITNIPASIQSFWGDEKGKAGLAAIHQYAEAKADTEFGVMRVMLALGKEKCELLPVPGSKSTPGSNQLAEFMAEGVERTNAKGGKSRGPQSHFKTMIYSSPEGAALVNQLQAIKAPEGSKLTGIQKARQSELRNRLNQQTAVLRKAAGLHHQLEWLRSLKSVGLRVSFVMVTDEKAGGKIVPRTKYPIKIDADGAEPICVSVEQVLRYDQSKWEKAVGANPVEKLQKTAEREPNVAGTKPLLKTEAEVVDAINTLNNYFDNPERLAAFVKTLSEEKLRAFAKLNDAVDKATNDETFYNAMLNLAPVGDDAKTAKAA